MQAALILLDHGVTRVAPYLPFELAKSTFEANGDVGGFANDTNSSFHFKQAQQDQGVNQNLVKVVKLPLMIIKLRIWAWKKDLIEQLIRIKETISRWKELLEVLSGFYAMTRKCATVSEHKQRRVYVLRLIGEGWGLSELTSYVQDSRGYPMLKCFVTL